MTLEEEILLFSHREIKAKDVFYIKEISKPEAYEFVRKYHYLGDAKFFCQQAFGLFAIHGDQLLGVATFCQPQGGYALKGWFGFSNSEKTVYELSRLCLSPALNRTNATSFLLGGSIRELKKQKKIRAVISLADSTRHIGSIYQVCNFKYYGLTPQKNIFYTAEGKKNPRIIGKKYVRGVWIPMSRKHRYAYLIDNSLKVLHKEEPRPTPEDFKDVNCCVGCGGVGRVHDARFDEWYSCPMCTGKLERLEEAND